MKVMPNTDSVVCCPSDPQQRRGVWTWPTFYFITPIKPGVLEVYYV